MKKFEQVFDLWNQMSLAVGVRALYSEFQCPEGWGWICLYTVRFRVQRGSGQGGPCTVRSHVKGDPGLGLYSEGQCIMGMVIWDTPSRGQNN